MKTVWTETAIRSEMARLDKRTGLKGAELPIRFNNARCTLGLYDSTDGGSFKFRNSHGSCVAELLVLRQFAAITKVVQIIIGRNILKSQKYRSAMTHIKSVTKLPIHNMVWELLKKSLG